VQFLQDISEIRLGHAFRGAVPVDPSGPNRVLQSKDLTGEGFEADAPLVRTTLEKVDQRMRLGAGDVVLQSRGSRFPALAARPELVGAIVAAPLYLIRPLPGVVQPEFVAIMLNGAEVQATLREAATGSYIPQVPVDAIRSIAIPVPSLADQHAIVAIAELAQRERQLAAALAAQRSVWLRAFALQRDKHGPEQDNSRRHANAPG
jgi:hypothetical protein